jgi:hypothetical protein
MFKDILNDVLIPVQTVSKVVTVSVSCDVDHSVLLEGVPAFSTSFCFVVKYLEKMCKQV